MWFLVIYSWSRICSVIILACLIKQEEQRVSGKHQPEIWYRCAVVYKDGGRDKGEEQLDGEQLGLWTSSSGRCLSDEAGVRTRYMDT